MDVVAGESQFAIVADALPVLISVIGSDGRYEFNNRAYEDWFGLTRGEIVGRRVEDVLGATAMERLRPHMDAALRGAGAEFVSIVPYRHGGVRQIDARYVPRRDRDGRVTGFIALVSDITDRERRDRELAFAFSVASMAPWDFDFLSGSFVSPARLNSLLGLPEEHRLVQADLWRMMHPDDAARLRARQPPEVLDPTARVAERDFRVVRPDGSVQWFLARGEYFRNAEGEPLRSVGVMLDITARKEAEEKALGQSERLRFLAGLASGLIAEHDPEARLGAIFAETARFLGADAYFHYAADAGQLRLESASGVPAELRSDFALVRLGDYPCGRIASERAPLFLTGAELDAGGRGGVLAGHGFRAYAGFPLAANDGLIGAVAFCSRVRERFATEDLELAATIANNVAAALDRARMEKRLRANEERLRLILSSATEYAIVTLCPEGRVTSWSDGAERLLGYSAAEASGRDEAAFFAPEDAAAGLPARERQKALAEGRATGERWHRRADGSRFWGSGTIQPLEGREGGFLRILRDRTEERQAENAVDRARRESERLAAEREAVLGQLAEGVIVADADGAITFINAAAERLHGAAHQGVTPEEYAARFHLYTEDGRPYPFAELPLTRAVRGGEVVIDARWRIRREDGTEVLAIGSATPVLDGEGARIGAVLTVRDDTARHAAERELRESTLRNELAIAAGRMGVWDWDVVQDRLVWDETQFTVWGVDPAGFAPSDAALQRLVHPEDLPGLTEASRASRRSGAPLDREFRIVRPDGAVRWIGVRAATLHDAEGRAVRMTGVNFDITERKRAEERRTLLINELNHRVKNTLATVQSIAAQTLRGAASPEAFRASFQARLLALSGAHNVLTRESWEGASLGEIAAGALAPFDPEGGRIAIEGPALQLAPKAALAFAMALHELATNAAKHGALSPGVGRLRLAWRVEPERDRLEVHWSETGGPLTATPLHKGFGSRLVERSFGPEIGGSVRMDFRPAGLVCTMQAALSSIAARGGGFGEAAERFGELGNG